MNTTFQNSAQVLSIGIFFTLMIVGITASLPAHLLHGLTAHGVPVQVADRAAHLSPVSTLFAAFLGYNPIEHLVGPHVLAQLTPAQQAALTGRGFFPQLIGGPFRAGLHAALDFAVVASLGAAWASWLRGGRYVYAEGDEADAEGDQQLVATGPPSVERGRPGDGRDRDSADLAAADAVGADTEALP